MTVQNNTVKYAIVSGASRGIGRAIAEKLAENNYNLILCCKNNIAMLNGSATELSLKHNILCKAFKFDLSDPDEVEALFSNIHSLDLLVNCAGISEHGILTETDNSSFLKIMKTNFDSVFYMCKGAVPLMLARGGGRIINISSVFGKTGASCEAVYSASKGALNSFTKSLAKELAPSNISVNAIAPGLIDTDMNRLRLSDEELNNLCEEIPSGRPGTAKEVAELVYLTAISPIYMTGQIISIDGGWT